MFSSLIVYCLPGVGCIKSIIVIVFSLKSQINHDFYSLNPLRFPSLEGFFFLSVNYKLFLGKCKIMVDYLTGGCVLLFKRKAIKPIPTGERR